MLRAEIRNCKDFMYLAWGLFICMFLKMHLQTFNASSYHENILKAVQAYV